MIVRILKIGPHEAIKEFSYKGVIKKNKLIVKTGKWKWQLWKRFIINSIPNPDLIDEEGIIYYLETSPNIYKQIKREINLSTIDIFTIVDNDVLSECIAAMVDVRNRYTPDSLWKKILPYAALTLVAITVIVLYVLLLNATKAGA